MSLDHSQGQSSHTAVLVTWVVLTDCVWDVETARKYEVLKIYNTKGKSFFMFK